MRGRGRRIGEIISFRFYHGQALISELFDFISDMRLFLIYSKGMERRSNIMAENYSFSVILEPQEGGGFTVLVPALPEVVTEGDTETEALANAEEAIRAILAYRAIAASRFRPMPAPKSGA